MKRDRDKSPSQISITHSINTNIDRNFRNIEFSDFYNRVSLKMFHE